MFLAAYKGDKLIAITETYEEMAANLKISINSVKWLSYESAHKRYTNERTLVYKYED